MNLITLIFSSCVHIFLVLILEGFALYVVFGPLIMSLVDNINIISKQKINKFIDPNYIPPVKWIRNPKTESSIKNPNYVPNDTDFFIKNPDYDPNDTDFFIKNPDYYNQQILLPTSAKSILRYGTVDETAYIKKNKYMSQIIYSSLLLCLVIIAIILIIISKKYDIKIDYKFTFFNSLLVFLIIGSYIGAFLWFAIFSQSYVLNFEKKIFIGILDFYNGIILK